VDVNVPGAVLVHGRWHGAWCWDAVRAALDERGVESGAVELPLTDLPADTRLGEAMVVSGDEVHLDPVLGPRLLHGDAAPDVTTAAAARLRPVSRPVFRGVPEVIAWRSVPWTYVVCAEDEIVHPERQRGMASRSTRTLEWPCGHGPVATRRGAVADLVAAPVGAVRTSPS
jgi:hypothetical protein